MLTLDIKPTAAKFIKNLPLKHQKQIKEYILNLQNQPKPHDSKDLKGYHPYKRGDIGEYRVIYKFSEQEMLLIVVLVGKRNGNGVYKKLKRLMDG